MSDVRQVEERIEALSPRFDAVRAQIGRVLVGQREMVDGLLTSLLADGHVLLEGAPGLAKTTAIRAMAEATHLPFSRLQFTPDLLPADLVGTQIYEPASGGFTTRRGPVFASLVLADEINRAPAKVQSALLEAMQERQVTLGDQTLPLPRPFLVLATQNPVEQEGTYPLPEAQTDRFLLKLTIDYPTREDELEIVVRSAQARQAPEPVCSAEDVMAAQALVREIKVADALLAYIVDLVRATRDPGAIEPSLANAVAWGASPRAAIAIAAAARARAFLEGRGFTLPEDVRAVAPAALRHRMLPTWEAEADGLDADAILAKLLDRVPMA